MFCFVVKVITSVLEVCLFNSNYTPCEVFATYRGGPVLDELLIKELLLYQASAFSLLFPWIFQ